MRHRGRRPPSRWGYHETIACKDLGIVRKEALSVRSQLEMVVAALKKGFSGSKRGVEPQVFTSCGIIDLKSSHPNNLHVYMEVYGDREDFPTDGLEGAATKASRPRYFWFGVSENSRVPIKIQLDIVNAVTGADRKLDAAIQTRRRLNWLEWY